jgi:dihydrofolate synthase/folylpolyglutamate synthase
VLLEVGLGGRLDAVNIVDPDIAVITGIALDHQEWLGDTREKIAVEKAGIFRSGIPVVIGDPMPPVTLPQAVEHYKVQPFWQGQDFYYELNEKGFSWQNQDTQYSQLPVPYIPSQNASTALQVIQLLNIQLDHKTMAKVFEKTCLPGRRQVIKRQPLVMLDVAHNPQATELLASDLLAMGADKVIAVVAMLADKDIAASLAPMTKVVDLWHCAELKVPRAGQVSELLQVLPKSEKVLKFTSVKEAYHQALESASSESIVICFGSFFTVADVLELNRSTTHK